MSILKKSALCMITILLVGCSSSENNPPDAPETTSETQIQQQSAKVLPAGAISFAEEVKRVSEKLRCNRGSILPAAYGSGATYLCVSGEAETVKVSINEELSDGSMKNAVLTWNDWFKDAGDGLHADKAHALAMLDAFLKIYPSKDAEKIKKTFLGNKNRSFKLDKMDLEYTYHRGPAIDARMIVVTPHYTIRKTEQTVASAKSDFDICKEKVEKFIGYSKLSGDGEPINEAGYISFMLEGQSEDLFFCEIHPNGVYKIKAALKGEYPFKYVAEGRI